MLHSVLRAGVVYWSCEPAALCVFGYRGHGTCAGTRQQGALRPVRLFSRFILRVYTTHCDTGVVAWCLQQVAAGFDAVCRWRGMPRHLSWNLHCPHWAQRAKTLLAVAVAITAATAIVGLAVPSLPGDMSGPVLRAVRSMLWP